MELHNLSFAEGSRKPRKRIGRGQGSGRGGTSTKGHKGQKSRSGYNYRAWFEGGQMPLQRRVPKFGFNNIFRVEYSAVNLDVIQMLTEQDANLKEISLDYLRSKGIVSGSRTKVKILGRGEVSRSLTVSAHKFSATAKAAIEAAGGTVIELNR
jgi:large subunit ribosomal protein L15